MQDLLDLRFIVVAGKGGVGRTTVSAALALSAARRGKRVLIAMCNAKERLSYLLQTDPIGPHIQNILPNIEAVNMRPRVALEEYGMMILRVRALYRIILENRFVAAFLRGTPGLDAWALLGKAQYHVRETDDKGRSRFDLVILDAPATGHVVDMLRVPRVIVQAAPPGLLRREAEEAWELFSDAKRTGICLITLPEEIVTNETLELYRAVSSDLRLPVCCLMINQVLPKLFAGDECASLERLTLTKGDRDDPALASMVNASRARAVREQIQQNCIKRLREGIPLPGFELPLLSAPDFRRRQVQTLSEIIENGVCS